MAKLSNCNKLLLLMWKNWKIQKNHKIGIALEILLPVIFGFVLVYVRLGDQGKFVNTMRFKSMEVENLSIFEKKVLPYAKTFRKVVMYTPSNPILHSIVESAANSLGLEAEATKSVKTLEESFQKGPKFYAGIVFDEDLKDLKDIKTLKKFSFTLRYPKILRTSSLEKPKTWLTEMLFPKISDPSSKHYKAWKKNDLSPYLKEGFLSLQNQITRKYLELISDNQNIPNVVLQRFPARAHYVKSFLHGLDYLLEFLLLVSFIAPCVYMAERICAEKERALKGVMKTMEVPYLLQWASWFLSSFILMAISALLLSIILTIKFKKNIAVLTYTHWSLFFFFLVVHAIALIAFCYLITTFFSKSKSAAAAAGVIIFAVYTPYALLGSYIKSVPLKLAWCLFVNSAMGFSVFLIMKSERLGQGIQWSTLFTPVSEDDSLTLGAIILMMLLSSLICFVLAWYIEQLFPGAYEERQRWNFIFTKKFWRKSHDKNNDFVTFESEANKPLFENVAEEKKIGIQVIDLHKSFKRHVTLKGLTLKMYQNEITVLLGPDGSGKTTMLLLLAKFFPPSFGLILIDNVNIRNKHNTETSVGISPQRIPLFKDLTVVDHIEFFSRLKGLRGNAVKGEVNKYLKVFHLEHEKRQHCYLLSEGLKRKVSIICALCGGSKVVLCDEPSLGLDPHARRQLWNLLQREKIGRTIVVTTRYPDEADGLADRIAIIDDGKAVCVGSSFFLRKKVGLGYTLRMDKSRGCNTSKVTELLSTFIPNIKVRNQDGSEISYLLPDIHSNIFGDILKHLEENSDTLRISRCRIVISSIEDVLMRVCTGSTASNMEDLCGNLIKTEKVSECELICSKWKAMFFKKLWYTRWNWVVFIVVLLIPLISLLATLLLVQNSDKFANTGPKRISLTQYNSPIVVLDTSEAAAPGSFNEKIMQYYQNTVNCPQCHFEKTGGDDFEKYILKKGKKEVFERYYVAAATIKDNNIIAWLNNLFLHTAPLTLNLVYTAIARALLDSRDQEIIISNWPLSTKQNTGVGMLLATEIAKSLCFSLSFVTAFFIYFIVHERHIRSKLLQLIGGVNIPLFWFTHLAYDYIIFTLISLIIIITLCFAQSSYSTVNELGPLFLILLLFGFPALLVTYALSFLFKQRSTAFCFALFLNLGCGLAMFIMVQVMLKAYEGIAVFIQIIQWIFMLYPHFALAWAIYNLRLNTIIRMKCAVVKKVSNEPCRVPSYFTFTTPGIVGQVFYFFLTTVICFVIIFLAEYGRFSCSCKCKKRIPREFENDYLDEDVAKENRRVAKMSKAEIAKNSIVLNRLTKYYKKDFVAVNQISIAVKSSEFFCMYGVNGAGKTTTFKMLTGDTLISSGHGYFRGINLNKDVIKTYSKFGYCPQVDALLEDFTIHQTMKMFCLIQGIPKDKIRYTVDGLANFFGFKNYMKTRSKDLSLNVKRLLSCAIALVGDPPIIYFDEPANGVDPKVLVSLRDRLFCIRDSGKTVILASNSVSECAKLCTHFAVMVNGEFKFMGSPHYLNSKLATQLQLKIRTQTFSHLNVALNNLIIDFVHDKFPDAELKGQYNGILIFYLPMLADTWTSVVKVMENIDKEFKVIDYFVSHVTLEEIFNELAEEMSRGNVIK